MRLKPRSFVVDACIARSSGHNEKPVSTNCRVLLEVLLDSHNIVCFNKELSMEWNTHQSSFARKWRTSMVARRKIKFIDNCENIQLRELLINYVTSEKNRLAAMKDIHLVEIALISDKVVLSNDDTVRTIFWDSMKNVSMLKEIIWFNPVDQFSFVIEWIKDGAKISKELFFMNQGIDFINEAATGKSN
ncbi:hypothetical protein LOZ80_14405 [Paenibacillus sp. HWE-109]|uniref:hypothetical protein n=1 Tax=Paenibacillus sp. HWE-109 TaxID=1306526 RepID=UPI001EDD54E1|nr:hypothetical protein [Paenibacillus sp. HWE-109]UKS30056.1 hypothetical protein LOZ80_14405 [Paenibacillus sp. HWE-109]